MKFIIADASGDMAKVLYNDLVGKSDYVVLDKAHLYRNKLVNSLCRANISVSSNMKHRMPLKQFFYKRLFGSFNPNERLCFYFGTAWFDPELFSFIKRKYQTAKLVLNFHDTVESKLARFKDMSIESINETFDLVYTYSEIDAEKYGFQYTPDMYSKLDRYQLKGYPEADVVFVGASKDRLGTILSIYEKLTSQGCNCWFYIVGAKPEERKFTDKIIYSDSYLPFIDVISRQVCSKCILEITQAGSIDATLRFWDAVMYDKKIITNCMAVKKHDYYSDKNVQVFKNIDDIDASFIFEQGDVEYHYAGDISPIAVFNTIDRELGEGQ